LAELEKRPGLHLHVLVLRKQFERSCTFVRHGVTFHLIKTPPLMRAPSFFWVDTLLIKRVLRQIGPDMLHAWGTEHGAALVASRLPYPYLVTMQGLLGWLAEVLPLNRYQRFVAFLEKVSLARASVVTAESTFAVQYLKARFPHLEICQVEHAPQPLFHQVQRRPQLRPPRFLFVSPFTYGKGADLLIQALDRLRPSLEFELTVVGPTDEGLVRSLRAATSPSLWTRTKFRNNLTSDEIADELASATLLLCPTRADNSPNAVKEAVVAGVPVVAGRTGGIPDYVFPGENGVLFSPGDLSACLDGIRMACQHPLFGRGLVEPEVLTKTRAYLSAKRMGQAFFETYQRIWGQRNQSVGEKGKQGHCLASA
jgi:glycosyltransferase involved in cell wall biosynthesis